jgi:hypothetical protein
LENIWKEVTFADSRYDPRIYLEKPNKTTEYLNGDSRCPVRDSNQAPIEYNSRALPLRHCPSLPSQLEPFSKSSAYTFTLKTEARGSFETLVIIF